ncbi:hypothetical protein [Streptomyces marispadix]|uniref:Uncharacterized protein n=1 Tax=Streptomyces marispadix TaxID=2922868 RepID=A0ABS9SZF0_9ACTN|nr:hypothetical protein [Streptomyces marispadix]MCH6161655.1 hypothetical protein [Streptomyces marispadix]
MTNPYGTPVPPAPRPPTARPLHKRVLVWVGGSALFLAGAVVGSAGNDGQEPVEARVRPETTVTATPEPGPTVTETAKAKARPGPTVTVTKAAASGSGDTGGDSDSSNGEDSAGSCSIVSNSGNCYSAGQYCRNSDHGAVTTTESGARIKCAQRSNAWRWTYA